MEIPIITQWKYLPELLFLIIQFLSTNYHYPMFLPSLAGNLHLCLFSLAYKNAPFSSFFSITWWYYPFNIGVGVLPKNPLSVGKVTSLVPLFWESNPWGVNSASARVAGMIAPVIADIVSFLKHCPTHTYQICSKLFDISQKYCL